MFGEATCMMEERNGIEIVDIKYCNKTTAVDFFAPP